MLAYKVTWLLFILSADYSQPCLLQLSPYNFALTGLQYEQLHNGQYAWRFYLWQSLIEFRYYVCLISFNYFEKKNCLNVM